MWRQKRSYYHLHFEEHHVFRHCMPSKGNNDLHLHFEDDHVFRHYMPLKGDNDLHTFQRRRCLQSLHVFKRWQCLHLHFEDNNVFSHCMSSKGNNAIVYAFKDDNVFISKTSISFVLVLHRTQRPLFLWFSKKNKMKKKYINK